jgi:multiple sugar transport system substrate-binding protein
MIREKRQGRQEREVGGEGSGVRRRAVLVAGGGTTGILLGACGGTGSQEGAGSAPAQGAGGPAGPVDYATFASGASLDATRETADRFAARYPGAQVNVIVPPPGQVYGDVLLAMTAAGTPPDVMLVNNDQVALYATQGLLGPLEPLLNRDRREMGDYFPLGLRVYRFQEQQVCIPGDLNAVGIYLNRTLLQQAGVTPPPTDFRTAGWTADDLLALARRLTRPDGGGGRPQFGFAVDNWIGRWFPFLWGNGGDAFDDWNSPRRFTFVSPATETTLQWLADLRFRHLVAPRPADLEGTTGSRLFMEGRVAMLQEVMSLIPELVRVPGLQWDVAPVARGPRGRVTRLAGAGYGLHPQAKHRETGWSLVRFLTGPEALAQTVQWTIPPTRTAAGAQTVLQGLPAATKQTWLQTLEYGRSQPLHIKWQQVMEGDGARKHYNEALDGKRSVQDALEAIKDHAAAMLQ